jgi:hypothetical protein
MSIDSIDRKHVVAIAHGFQVDDQRRMPQQPQCGRPYQRTFHTVRHAVPQDQPGRIAGVASRFQVVSDLAIEKALDACRRGQLSQNPSLARIERDASTAAQCVSALLQDACRA